MQSETILSATRVLLPHGVWLAPGAVSLRKGRIQDVGDPKDLQARSPAAERIDLGGCALLPGLVNAHTHLELSALAGKVPRGAGFETWVREVVRVRAESSHQELEAATLRGARLCLSGGTTTVGDLDATGCGERAWSGRLENDLPRVLLFRELLDARRNERIAHEIARIGAPWAATDFLIPGLAPHAPHTVSELLLRAASRAAQRAGYPLTTHWAETRAEVDWLEAGRGPFASLLGDSPRRSGLDLLESAGVLGPSLALVHGNLATADEIARVARAGATLVHCPGSHAFFEREAFPLRQWRAAGVTVALGTDSLASNSALDMRLELSRFVEQHPWLEARDALDAATIHAAKALGLNGRVGVIAPGAFADLIAVPAPESDAGQCLARLARGEFEIRHLWLGARAVSVAEGPGQ